MITVDDIIEIWSKDFGQSPDGNPKEWIWRAIFHAISMWDNDASICYDTNYEKHDWNEIIEYFAQYGFRVEIDTKYTKDGTVAIDISF